MMRSLFSGVAGLKTHQTRMDVIGNNIANVNTTAYKSQSMVFSDLLYQTTQAASGANANTGRGGINPRQIGLGAKTGAISTAISSQGSAQSTNNPWDVMITGDSFFIVSDGSQNFFTRDGSFKIDGMGNLVMANTGYMVMGWQVDASTGEILPDAVSALQVMKNENLTYPPEATTKSYISGILDMYDTALTSTAGRIVALNFYDNRGYSYTAKFSIHSLGTDGQYYTQLDDILDSDGVSLVKKYNLSDISQIATFGGDGATPPVTALYNVLDTAEYDAASNTYSMKYYMKNIIKGFSSNTLLTSADSLAVEMINPTGFDTSNAFTGGTAVTAGTDVYTVTTADGITALGITATTQLDQTLLNQYGIVWNDKTDSYWYYDSSATGAVPSVANTELNTPALWETALQGMLTASGATVKVQSATLNEDVVTLSYSMVCSIEQPNASEPVTSINVSTQTLTGGNVPWQDAYGVASTDNVKYELGTVSPDGSALITKTISYTGNRLTFNVENGEFVSIGESADATSAALNFFNNVTSLDGTSYDLSFFYDQDIDFSRISNVANGGTSTVEMTSGDGSQFNLGAGRKEGELIGIEIGQDGKLTASYDNGQTKLLGQIAVANFANPAGLSKAGNNLYSATQNSGEFNGTGVDITADGGSMESGVLEMSNVDLSSEFTEMITTQRGFQANSRIITVSDTLLEELVNLKR